jgi:hypothetical protein
VHGEPAHRVQGGGDHHRAVAQGEVLQNGFGLPHHLVPVGRRGGVGHDQAATGAVSVGEQPELALSDQTSGAGVDSLLHGHRRAAGDQVREVQVVARRRAGGRADEQPPPVP